MTAVLEAASFQGSLLPTEIILEIMKYLPDFSCLWALINASSRFKSVFMAFAGEIVEDIMTKTLPMCTQALMRIVIHTRISPSMFTSISDIVSYMSRKKKRQSPNDFSRENTFGPSLPKSPLALYDFVERAHTIHEVAHACLDFYIARFINMKPQRMSITDQDGYSKLKNAVYHERQAGEPFQPKEFGPPTYLEEQILIRVLWRLQVSLDIKAAYKSRRLVHWPEEDLNHIETVDIPEMLYRGLPATREHRCEMQQAHSVLDFIHETTGEDQYGRTENVLTHFLNTPVNKGYRLSCQPEPGPSLQKIGGLGERLVDVDSKIEIPTIGWMFYHFMVRCARPPMKDISFTPYRKFGFALWQLERMEESGVLGPKARHYGLMNNTLEPWFIWRSILTPEEDAERRD